jgi:DNA-binding transcriptional regulator YiaG
MPEMNQHKYLSQSEKSLGVGPVEMARLLDTPYNTYKAWKSGRNKLPGAAIVAINIIINGESK